jgi:predicted nucleic acid-binding protein
VIVADASVIVEFLLNAAVSPHVASLIAGEDVLAAPVLLDYEVMSALRRQVFAKEISDARARAALLALADLSIDRHAIDPFVDRIWSLRRNLTVYDASYVVLAEYLGAALHTLDTRLAKSSGHRARIVVM